MSEEQNDSPAFRLRPRRAEPKSYYTVRLEYSANPAAFTRERPRLVGAKRKATSQRSSTSATTYSRAKQTKTGNYNYGHLVQTTATSAQVTKQKVVTKEDLEREYRRKLLQREIAESITEGTMISPFMQRIELDELKPDSIYEQNYVTLRIKNVEQTNEKNHLVCRCHSIDGDPDNAKLRINVQLYDDYASTSLLKNEKIINIGKFRTGSKTAVIKSEDNDERVTGNGAGVGGDIISDNNSETNKYDWIGFDVIVKYEEQLKTSGSSPLIPFVSITDMIEKPTEPFVEMAPPSPPSATQQKVPNLPKRIDTNRRLGEASNGGRQLYLLPTDNGNDEDEDTDTDYGDDKTGECDDLDGNNHQESDTKVKFPAIASTAV